LARAKGKAADSLPNPAENDAAGYTVVARRYRPQRFEEVVGQDHVVQALRNAIRLNKVTHAYLFSGTRGVGKTSVARIFAKCLNCVEGPTEEPCLTCDICQAIAVGQDVDVIEIDGASNNGVEAVRELRQNASLRPSRARYKIYYIDEVHMLSTGAFNALLKTLEEPPEHVKFFFATTEPNKIPITVLSRCQHYEFASIAPEQIVESLAEICAREQVQADAEALHTVARRAGGSLRDAQSQLEQLLSLGERHLTTDAVHKALGTAPDERILDLIDALASRDAKQALLLVNQSVSSGIQPIDLLNGLLEFMRDVLVLAAGADVPFLAAPPNERARLQAIVERWPFETVLAAQQILAEARSRMRGSPHGRQLVELALLRVAWLENLTELSDVVARLTALESRPATAGLARTPGSTAAQPLPKKKPTATPAARENGPDRPTELPTSTAALPASPPAHSEPADLSLPMVLNAWSTIIQKVGLRYGAALSQVRPTATLGPDVLVIELPERYNGVADECGSAEGQEKIASVLQAVLGRPVSLRFERSQTSSDAAKPEVPAPSPGPDSDELGTDPLVQKVVELFEARRVLVDTEGETRD
jgi:DNA polymerase III subunit gamma/tau